MKTCSKCQQDKELEFFNKDKSRKDGFCHYCRDCFRAHSKRSYLVNKEKRLAGSAKWRTENKDKMLAARTRYLARTKDRRLDYAKNRRKEFPEIFHIESLKYRAKQKNLDFNLDVSDITAPEFCPILGIKLVRNSGKICAGSVTVDRIDSKQGYIKGNILVISNKANRLKGDCSLEDLEKVVNFYKGLECQKT